MPRLSWIFNYGSNHVEQLSGRIGRQISDGQRALVKGYQRVFRGWSERWGGGVGSLEAKRGAVTHGWAAKLTPAEFAKLDLHEGVASGHYARRVVKIVLPDTRKTVSGIVYVSLNEEHHPPSQAYLEACARTVGEWWSEEGRPVQPGDFPIRNNPPCPTCGASDAYRSPFSGRWECSACDNGGEPIPICEFCGQPAVGWSDDDRHVVCARHRRPRSNPFVRKEENPRVEGGMAWPDKRYEQILATLRRLTPSQIVDLFDVAGASENELPGGFSGATLEDMARVLRRHDRGADRRHVRGNPPCPKCKAADAYKSPFSGRWECRACDAPKVGSTASPFVGMRVRLAQDVDRYPFFVASRGRTGTVSSVDTDCIWVKMDQPLIGAEDWDNQIEWMYDNLSDFQEDVEVIGAAPARRNPPAIGRGRHVRRVIHAGHVDNGGAQIFTACGIWVAREDTNQSLDEITCRACLDEIEDARDEET